MFAFLKSLFTKKECMDEMGERKRKLRWYAKRVSKKYHKVYRRLAKE